VSQAISPQPRLTRQTRRQPFRRSLICGSDFSSCQLCNIRQAVSVATASVASTGAGDVWTRRMRPRGAAGAVAASASSGVQSAFACTQGPARCRLGRTALESDHRLVRLGGGVRGCSAFHRLSFWLGVVHRCRCFNFRRIRFARPGQRRRLRSRTHQRRWCHPNDIVPSQVGPQRRLSYRSCFRPLRRLYRFGLGGFTVDRGAPATGAALQSSTKAEGAVAGFTPPTNRHGMRLQLAGDTFPN